MPKASAVHAPLPTRRLLGLVAAFAALAALALPALAGARPHLELPKPAVLTFKVAKVGKPGNPSVAIVPFTPALYANCAAAPPEPKVPKTNLPDPCQEVGSVAYEYGIGEVEVTVEQFVAFLNTVDPFGRNQMDLYSTDESGAAWPRFGQIDYSSSARAGKHYTAAAPEWNDKPYGFADFLRAARFDNSVANGKVLSKTESTVGSGNQEFRYVTYKVRISRKTGTGMYDMHKRAPVRTSASGFVIPSQNEWIKAAYYNREGSGTNSYWWYPTGPSAPSPNDEEGAPAPVTLDPTTGDVTNANGQPLANFHAEGKPAAYWCPSNQTQEACETVNPLHLPAKAYKKAFQGSLNTVGQAATYGPWGTLEQGGNAVEWTDTITAPPFGAKGHRVWRRLHGGVPNAAVYQLWLSAIGPQPQKNTFFRETYPWLGFRIGVIGNPGGSGGK
ncbi:MAG TPA: hypothetical protein VHZ54_11390 [Solirubrobacterales bacterium]|jgi:hypothetical protein|nr:hypothetical protein [Solirubrobacterales bacterium]